MIRKSIFIATTATIVISNAVAADDYAKGYGDGFRDGQQACTQLAPGLELGGTLIPKVQTSQRRVFVPPPPREPSFPQVITPLEEIAPIFTPQRP